jgi:hypothetical protein
MGALKTLALAVLSILLVASLASFVVVSTARASLLDPGFYKQQLESQGTYAKLPPYLVDAAVGQMPAEVSQVLPQEDVRTILGNVFTAEAVKHQLEPAIDNSLAYLKGESTALNITIGMAEVKLGLVNSMGDYLRKKAAEQGVPAELVDVLVANLTPASIPLPDSIDVGKELLASSNAASTVGTLRSAIQLSGVIFTASAVAVLVLAALIIVIAGIPFGAMRALGGAVAAAGAIVLAVAYVAPGMAIKFLPKDIPEIASNLVSGLVNQLASSLYAPAIALLVFGLAAMAAAIVMARSKSNPPKPPKASKK